MKKYKPGYLRYVFSVQSDDGFYIDCFKDARAAFAYCDRLRRTGYDCYVVRDTYRENLFIRSAREITVRAIMADDREIIEKTYFCAPAAAVYHMRRLISGNIKSIGFVERRSYV